MRLQNLLGAVCTAVTLCMASLASAVIPESEQATAVEFYHQALDHYFITAEPAEINDLDTGKHVGWTRTGYKFAVIKAGSAYEGSAPICRFYSQTLDSHFYSANATECEDVRTKPEFTAVWQFEASEVYRAFPVDPATGACPADTTATYRLWDTRANHRYTDQLANYYYMVSKGYKPEGNGNPALPVVFCTPAGGDVVPPLPEGAPSCAVTASSGAPALGATLTLTAQCSNSPLYYLWQNCESTTATCTTTKTTAGSVPYTMYAANAVAPAEPVTINVNWGGGGGGGGAVPTCQLTANNANPQVGSSLVMTANCSQTPTSWEWLECNYLQTAICKAIPACPATSKTCTVTTSVSGYHRYTVAATNGAGTGTRVQLELEWAGTGNPNPPPGGGGQPVAAPECSLLTSDVNPPVGTPIRLTANCSNGPTSYSWGGATGCTGMYCNNVTASAAGLVTYSVSATNSGGTSATKTVDVTWRNAAPLVPNCTLATSNASPTVGASVTLTATCSNGPTSYAWTGCDAAPTSSTCAVSESEAGSKSYSVKGTNAAGEGPPASVPVTWSVPKKPTCTLQAPSSATVGTTVTITATCSDGPILSYEWDGCTPQTQTSSCTDSAGAVENKLYKLVATNAVGPSDIVPLNVMWIAAPTEPPSCTLVSSNASPTVGQSITLTASCTNSPTSHQWTHCDPGPNNPNSPTCIATATVAGPVIYSVVAGNQTGSFGNAGQTTVNWQAGGGGQCPGGVETIDKSKAGDWRYVAGSTVYFVCALEDGVISSQEGSGGQGVWGTVGNGPATIPFPLDSNITSYGKGSTSKKLPIKKGQYYSTYHTGSGQSLMRATMN